MLRPFSCGVFRGVRDTASFCMFVVQTSANLCKFSQRLLFHTYADGSALYSVFKRRNHGGNFLSQSSVILPWTKRGITEEHSHGPLNSNLSRGPWHSAIKSTQVAVERWPGDGRGVCVLLNGKRGWLRENSPCRLQVEWRATHRSLAWDFWDSLVPTAGLERQPVGTQLKSA